MGKTDQENIALKNTNQQITGKYNLLAKQKQEVENSTKLLAAEKENLSSEVQKHKNETAALNSKNVELTTANQKSTEDLTKVKGELVTKDKQLETNKVQIDKLKQLGRTLKSKNEGYAQEITS